MPRKTPLTLKHMQKELNLVYLNKDEHTHLDRARGNTDILDIAFVSPNLAKHDIQLLKGHDLGCERLPLKFQLMRHHRRTHLLTTLQSVSWILAEFYFNRGLQRLYTGTCIILQKTISGFLCLLIAFLKSKTYQLILKDVIKLNRNLR